jgi:lipopolysaccharide-induced tumor necrosis factor-alpha factor
MQPNQPVGYQPPPNPYPYNAPGAYTPPPPVHASSASVPYQQTSPAPQVSPSPEFSQHPPQPSSYHPPPPQGYSAVPTHAGGSNYPPPPATMAYPSQPAYTPPMGAPMHPDNTHAHQPIMQGHVIPAGQPIVYAQAPQVLSTKPQVLMCQHCHSEVMSTVRNEPGAVTWLSCLGCVVVGCWLGCCLIPFCVNELQDALHYCSRCGNFLGRKNLL